MPFTGKATFEGDDKLPELVDNVSDLVGLISPFDTPLLDAIGSPRFAAKSTRHEWFEGKLGADKDAPKISQHNYTQIFTETVMISGSLDSVGMQSVEREFDYQVIQRLRELLRSLEQTVINGAMIEPRKMGGLLQFIAGSDAVVEDQSAGALDETKLNAALRKVWEKGGRPNAIVCNGFQKRKIGTFIASSRRYEPETATLRNLVALYESDFGVQRVILSRWCPADKVLLLDLDKIQVLPLQGRSFFVGPQVKSGDFLRAQILGEYTLEALNAGDGGHGVMTNLAVS
jgi:hypothetical protein